MIDELSLTYTTFHAVTQATRRTLDRVAAELQEKAGVPLPRAELLAVLAGDPQCRVQMGDLAQALFLTPGSVSRLVGRMEADGLVRRQSDERDRRITYAVLTPSGRLVAERAHGVYLAAIQSTFGEALGAPALETMRESATQLLEHLGGESEWLAMRLRMLSLGEE